MIRLVSRVRISIKENPRLTFRHISNLRTTMTSFHARTYQANLNVNNMALFQSGFAAISAPRGGTGQRIRASMEEDSVFWNPPRSTTGATTEERNRESRSLFYGLFQVLVLIGAAAVKPARITDEEEIAKWETFVGTLARMTLEAPCTQGHYRTCYKAITGNALLALEEFTQRLAGCRSAAEAAGHDAGTASTYFAGHTAEINESLKSVISHLSLPTLSVDLGAGALALVSTCTSSREVASYYALIVYLAGKRVDASRANTFTVSRPKNLCDKFNHGKDWPSVKGGLRIKEYAYESINDMWEIDPSFRIAFFTPLIHLSGGEGAVMGNILFTMVKLLRWSQMAYVKIISDFLNKYPWVAVRIPEITGDIAFLKEGMARLAQVVPEEQLFHKLLHRDATDIFDRQKLWKLIGLAKHGLMLEDEEIHNYEGESDPMIELQFDTILQEMQDEVAAEMRPGDPSKPPPHPTAPRRSAPEKKEPEVGVIPEDSEDEEESEAEPGAPGGPENPSGPYTDPE
ncbi:ORF2 protein [Armillaria mellea negative-stranded RNA virus 1]|uniref:ORF2 protein n=1 Tax=Armillaria mellea negative-stranded RNA virus 1 TaxID=2827439 RepID=A0AAX1MD63_9MONO|nr:ORF2 protein [Armillaria mellea negative-stranded RNA virus 1]QUD20350.1 ORF2 protein [Armillaria mellea negative-stranded RNA virus 1]